MNEFTETKALVNDEARLNADTLQRAFEAFRETNNERIAQLEKRAGGSDPLTEDTLNRIEAEINRLQKRNDDLALKAKRPILDMATPKVISEAKQAFENYVRYGEMPTLERRAIQASVGSDGGFLVPVETENTVMSALSQLSPMRSICSVQQTNSNTYKQVFAPTRLATGWVGEAAARPQTTTISLEERLFPTMELYAMPAATQSILDDAVVNIDEWVAREVEMAFAEQETNAFINGNGTSQPKGITTYATAPVASAVAGQIGYVATGVASNFTTSNGGDAMLNLMHELKSPYRNNAVFVMNRRTLGNVRRLKSNSSEYLWQAPMLKDGRETFMGYPIVEVDAMPEMNSTSGFGVAFGDFKRAYLIVDRVGVNMLRDPYSSKPYTLFYTTKRVGGGVLDYDAVKFLKFAVS